MSAFEEYLPYQCFVSPEAQSSNVVPATMIHAQKNGFALLADYIAKTGLSPMDWLCLRLQSDREQVNQMLSPEQQDSVCAAIAAIEQKKEFIVGDKTGIGKGRILASLLRYACANDKNVVFVTESAHLFTDFWRDVLNVRADGFIQGTPFLLHPEGRVYSQDGEMLFKALSTEKMKEVLANDDFSYTLRKKTYSAYSNVIMTTYSQFSNLNYSNKKINMLEKFIRDDTVLLFDEFHNSIGDSNIRDMRNAILSLGGTAVYSSATFLNDYRQIYASFKEVFNLGDFDYKVSQLPQTEPNENLERQMSYFMTSNMMMLRREHQNAFANNYIEIPEDAKELLYRRLDGFREIVRASFQCCNLASMNSKGNADRKKLSKWYLMGSTINRMCRMLLLFSGKDTLIARTEETLSDNKKAVIVLDSTFESVSKQCQEWEDAHKNGNLEANQYTELYFGTLLKAVLTQTLEKMGVDFTSDNTLPALVEQYRKTCRLCDEFEKIPLSYIDGVLGHFEQNQTPVLEISGRSEKTGYQDGIFTVKGIGEAESNRALNIQKFNRGNADIIILTRSGATGISLHADATFADQRVRRLIEVEISPRVKIREQFYGRVNRRGEVVEPEYETLYCGTLFEKRMIALEERKLMKMRAMTGSEYKGSRETPDYYNQAMDDAAKEYLLANPEIAGLLGISLFGRESKQHYFIDYLLKRSLLLYPAVQKNLFDYLENAYCLKMTADETLKKYFIRPYGNNFTIDAAKIVWISPYHRKNTDGIKAHRQMKTQVEAMQPLDFCNTNLPVVAALSCRHTVRTPEISEQDLKRELEENTAHFQKDLYLERLRGIYAQMRHRYDDNHKQVIENLQQMAKLQIGTQIGLETEGDTLFGYIADIVQPPEEDSFSARFINQFMFRICLVNKNKNTDKIRVEPPYIDVLGSKMIQSGNLSVFGAVTDFSKYVREQGDFLHESEILCGHIFHLHYLSRYCKLGQVQLFQTEKNGMPVQFLGLMLPRKMTADKLIAFLREKPPILSVYEVAGLLNKHGGVKDWQGNVFLYKDEEGEGYTLVCSLDTAWTGALSHGYYRTLMDAGTRFSWGQRLMLAYYIPNYDVFIKVMRRLFNDESMQWRLADDKEMGSLKHTVMHQLKLL